MTPLKQGHSPTETQSTQRKNQGAPQSCSAANAKNIDFLKDTLRIPVPSVPQWRVWQFFQWSHKCFSHEYQCNSWNLSIRGIRVQELSGSESPGRISLQRSKASPYPSWLRLASSVGSRAFSTGGTYYPAVPPDLSPSSGCGQYSAVVPGQPARPAFAARGEALDDGTCSSCG